MMADKVDMITGTIKAVLTHADYRLGDMILMTSTIPCAADLVANYKIIKAVVAWPYEHCGIVSTCSGLLSM